MFCLPVCSCTTWMPCSLGGQKGISDPLTLNYRWLWTIKWMLRIVPGYSGKAASALNWWTISQSPMSTLKPTKPKEENKTKTVFTRSTDECKGNNDSLKQWVHIGITSIIGGTIWLTVTPCHSLRCTCLLCRLNWRVDGRVWWEPSPLHRLPSPCCCNLYKPSRKAAARLVQYCPRRERLLEFSTWAFLS